ncbi:hypothetical protein [Thermomonospora cellulosilytica]|uniref:Uncharacterized protein n=1 Tax=Thermomonospora cellulosilytica TaxID=1411118 RepID=A0A7W3R9N5_9ACTN|nr:hypothetical protein [Thermomonospora cellulosilytica]MBA9005563.1 hypothetical protein [Thermomonospora cellulosilytica]
MPRHRGDNADGAPFAEPLVPVADHDDAGGSFRPYRVSIFRRPAA